MSESTSGPTERVRAQVGPELLRQLEQELSTSDLTTLLLSVARTRAARVSLPQLASAYRESRFVAPASVDPRALIALEHRMWDLVPDNVAGVTLSPVAPFGTCATMAGVDQDRIVTTMRAGEVVSDATNVLALEAARRRHEDRGSDVHVAACHRVLRAQQFPPGFSAHFSLFCLVSSARDRGSGTTQIQLLATQLRYWRDVLDTLLPTERRWHIDYTIFRAGAVAERLVDQLIPELGDAISFRELTERSGADYYQDVAFKIVVETAEGSAEIGDGGLTSWTADLMSDAKERCLISCLSTERLLVLT